MLAAMAECQLWRDRDTEVGVFSVSPPGLVNPFTPPYKSQLYMDKKASANNVKTHIVKEGKRIKPESNVKANIVKEVSTDKGLRICTINVTSWSPKIQTMITKMSNEYDIILIQEHHKFRRRDMKTGPYIIAGFAPAQRTVRTKNGRGWHSSGGQIDEVCKKNEK